MNGVVPERPVRCADDQHVHDSSQFMEGEALGLKVGGDMCDGCHNRMRQRDFRDYCPGATSSARQVLQGGFHMLGGRASSVLSYVIFNTHARDPKIFNVHLQRHFKGS